jgi:hypothetical protein
MRLPYLTKQDYIKMLLKLTSVCEEFCTPLCLRSHLHSYPRCKRSITAQSVEHWAMGWTIRVLGFDSWWGLGIFLFITISRMALGPTQPPIQWVSGALSLGVKRPGREADHSPPSSAEVKNVWSYTSTPPIRLHGMVLI